MMVAPAAARAANGAVSGELSESEAAAPSRSAPPAPAGHPSGNGLAAVESPMVGTFYSAPNPDAGPFVTVGSAVSPETVVCMIEAMKVFNEIKAEVNGTVERVLVNSGDAVEFGQKLFLVRPG